MTRARCLLLVLAAVAIPRPAPADDAPYQRGRPQAPRAGVFKDRIVPHWFAEETRFWYRNDLKGGAKEFVLVDAEKGSRQAAFDHRKLAAGLSKAAGQEYRADKLPFNEITFTDDGKAVRFDAAGKAWACDLSTYECTETGPAKKKEADEEADEPADADPDPVAPYLEQQPDPRRRPPERDREVTSPDGKWVAFVRDHNVFLRPKAGGEAVQLSKTGVEGNAFGMLSWAPDGKAVVGFRIEPGENKEVYLIESSPRDGGRAKLSSRPYPLPGDKFTAYEPWVFDPTAKTATKADVDRIDFGRPRVRWARDGRHFTYEKVDRGHQRFRLVEVDSHTGQARNLIDEKSDTFIWTVHFENVGLPSVTWLEKTDEAIYPSEKDGWRHLYLIDTKAGTVKNPITKGEWVVRGIDRIDEAKRQVWFRASGRNPDQDPYFVHHYRINFDGTGLVALTDGNGTHTVQFSPNRKYLVDTYSRVDAAPVHELRRTDDGGLVTKLEEADVSELKMSGWEAPEVFVAKGRDGKTDIWGIVCRPKGFDPAKKYPVIEQIYAGPQGSFVPKSFSPFRRFSNLTDLGFVVVQMDGMGTANRSKAFHDVCWKNLKDAGFPDRILWHKAAAAKYPWYDTTRVGIYGGSAGGQNSTAAVLFHPDFYKVAVSGCGCHDNRMDKASWNEQWMGYPVGPQYAACSNIDNAHRLRGKLLLIVGEMDTNVPPESTYRLCDALIKAGKDFDFLMVPGAGHGMGGAYGQRRLQDFFVRHLLGTSPPDRNASKIEPEPKKKDPEPLNLAALVARPVKDAAVVTRRYEADRGSLTRTYAVPTSPTRAARLAKFYSDWLAALKAVDPEAVSSTARDELAGLRAKVEGELRDLEAQAAADAAAAPLLPFAGVIVGLEEARRRMEPIDPEKAAATLAGLPRVIEKATAIKPTDKRTATHAADATDRLRTALKAWFGFYDGYDPLFTWWVTQPYKQADQALEKYAKALREKAGSLPEGTKPTKPGAIKAADGPADAPNLTALLTAPRSEMIPVIQKYQGGDRGWRGRQGGAGGTTDRDPARWLAALAEIDFDKLSHAGQIDYVLLRTHLQLQARRAELRAKEPNRPVVKDESGISGRPIGREAVLAELAGEMIPYTPEELIALARAELDWCDAEIRKASREMGYRDDWHRAVEKVKTLHVPPGGQPRLIRDLAAEATDYLKAHDLVTVPPLAAETWRMQMMTPERQLVNPFFTGGEVISVSYPTAGMSHDAKLQSMRGNNPHFSRATVHHELIPGHHLQGFMSARENPHRGLFGTAFWTEGNAVYWEMVLYDRGFPKTPEDRVGFLVWRMHRCARVVFSLGFHLGQLTPKQCVELLVERVGFEPENAAAEVRRSFGGSYGPLYQAAYLVGAMQFRALRKELVDSGAMTDRAFHDAILRENRIPIEMVRAALTGQPLTRDHAPSWRFAGTPSAR